MTSEVKARLEVQIAGTELTRVVFYDAPGSYLPPRCRPHRSWRRRLPRPAKSPHSSCPS